LVEGKVKFYHFIIYAILTWYPAADVYGFYDVYVCPSNTMDQMCEIRTVTYIY